MNRTALSSVLIACALSITTALAYAKGGHGGSRGGSSGSHSHGGSSNASKPKGAGGAHSVAGHTDKRGRYVKPHRQTNPNGTKSDNWSSKGNVNPDTGQAGTK